MFSYFSSKISTDIGGLRVDTATDSSEESDSRSTETIARDELEKEAYLVGNLKLSSLVTNEVQNTWSVRKNQDFKNCECESDKAETKNLTSCKSDHKSFILAFIAEIGYLYVSNRGNFHADEACTH